jgi:GNAT superfamily N-acetyltransferase
MLIRQAVPDDCPSLLALVHALAHYEKAEGSVKMTEDDLRVALFGDRPMLNALVADVDGELAGSALYFFTFSTWTGKPGLFLEDLFVRAEHRRRGTGRALFTALAAQAVEKGCTRLEWAVLDWNQPAIDFYRSLGAVAMDEWTTFRLAGPALAQLAARSEPV